MTIVSLTATVVMRIKLAVLSLSSFLLLLMACPNAFAQTLSPTKPEPSKAVERVQGRPNSSDVRELKFGKSLEREISKGEVHEYRLELRSRQILFVDLQEQTFDVRIELVKARDKQSVVTANVGSGLDRE